MQDSLLRLVGVVGAAFGIYVYVEGQKGLGVALIALGLIVVIKTTHLIFRQFGGWRPHGAGKKMSRKERADLRNRGEERLRQAADQGPGARHGGGEPGQSTTRH